ncbi:hypothetical protein PYCCODRAFT_1413425 [Trametes coccinea BRFM310]|uniref:Uncharacterized protein n=1 Tax=Trametes coccinea (strain BRFM310) TaxID=1353009 RepID=A0A1Y2IIW0_TRAC3|nr:hypothetical protein PYCCODRAFT_1413425 [Trametes coccinea BRFM310]
MPLSTMSNMSSPTPSRYPDLPVPRTQSVTDFEIEHPKGTSSPSKQRRRGSDPEYDTQAAYRAALATLVKAKARPFAISGRVPMDPSNLKLFFRSQSGISHSLDFPIDVDVDMPPALDTLIAACLPHPSASGYAENETLFYPPSLPLTATLELANHPILEAVRNTLFPALPVGHYLTAVRDKLELWPKGNAITVQSRPLDNRVATVLVTLPVRFRGGSLVVRSVDGMEEKFYGRGGKGADLEWAAFLSDCDYEIQPVRSGCRMTISYAVQVKSFGPAGIQPDPLITPSDRFLDLLSPVLNMSRGRRIAFYLTGEYGVNPGEVLAESLVPTLKGGDSVLYHALKLYKLAPELRWTAGGYIWAVDQTVEFANETADSPTASVGRQPLSILSGARMPPIRGPFSSGSEPGEDDADDLRQRVVKSGAVPITDTDITIVSDIVTFPGLITKERVPFVSSMGEIEKLVVNVLMVVYIP